MKDSFMKIKLYAYIFWKPILHSIHIFFILLLIFKTYMYKVWFWYLAGISQISFKWKMKCTFWSINTQSNFWYHHHKQERAISNWPNDLYDHDLLYIFLIDLNPVNSVKSVRSEVLKNILSTPQPLHKIELLLLIILIVLATP